MIFTPTKLSGATIIDIEPRQDSRGLFARIWCEREFAEHGLNTRLAQANLSFNYHAGTLRGMHYQAAPDAEVKLVRCTSGAIYDVIIDLRPDSPTYCEWIGVELTAENRRMLYVPQGFAHGYQTLTDNAEVAYQVSQFYVPASERGVRWDDPVFGIEWHPITSLSISEKDAKWADYQRATEKTGEET